MQNWPVAQNERQSYLTTPGLTKNVRLHGSERWLSGRWDWGVGVGDGSGGGTWSNDVVLTVGTY